MNIKHIFKTLFIIAMLVLLVIMGLNNRDPVTLNMPRIPTQKQPAALMYIGFFGLGFLAGAIIMAGGKKGASAKSNKVQT
jgi:uncharacterized integral membrane protein